MSHAYSKRAVYMCYYSGLLEGDENGWFRPAASTTRAALATVCCRLIGAVKRPTPYVSPDAEVLIPHPYFYRSLDANGLVIDDPEVRTHGELPTSSCRTYNLQALSLARAGIDSEGLYLTVTAPQLPAEIDPDASHVAVTPDAADLEELFAELAAILTELDEDGMEHQRGMKAITIPAHSFPGCKDIRVTCIRFVVPDDLNLSGGGLCSPRRFKARFLANSIDTDYRCCESMVTL